MCRHSCSSVKRNGTDIIQVRIYKDLYAGMQARQQYNNIIIPNNFIS